MPFLSAVYPAELSPQATEHLVLKEKAGRQPRSFRFESFLLQPERQSLTKFHAPVRIGGRALDLLTLLVERAGEIVSKRELLARAWPETFVEESNLKVNIANLRRLLGDTCASPRFVATVAGRGYRFIAAVEYCGPGDCPGDPQTQSRSSQLFDAAPGVLPSLLGERR